MQWFKVPEKIYFEAGSIQYLEKMPDIEKDIILAMAECDLKKFAVAKKLHCHRNTVTYHIEKVKDRTGLDATKFYDLLIDGESILSNYSYQEYIEIVTDGMRLGRMKTYLYSVLELMEGKDE